MTLLRRLFFLLVTLPLVLVAIAFGVANRGEVMINWNPLETPATPLIGAPLYVIVFLAFGLGAITGAFIVWNKQRRWRRAARDQRQQAEQLQYELNRLRAEAPPLALIGTMPRG